MTKTKISAEIIADSKNEHGQRLTTFVVKFPRIILAEFNTHRMLSRNSASSRAIPFERMLKLVQEDPFIPIAWMKDHKGMQGNEFFTDVEEGPFTAAWFENQWLDSRDTALTRAKLLSEAGLTKQIVNRLLEPFMWHTVIVTGSEWENFFALRAHGAAEIHMEELANRMMETYNNSTPKLLKAGEWHIPFGDKLDEERLMDVVMNYTTSEERKKDDLGGTKNKFKIQIATARCARVSYLNFEGKDDYEADIKLHDNLLTAGHMSPFEHCAKAMNRGEFDSSFHKGFEGDGPEFYTNGWSGNFRGFIQYRKLLPGENKTDSRIIIK